MARILKDTEKKLSPEFQNRLKEFIDDNEWNNEQFAALVGVSKPVILRATIYGIIPALRQLIKIADYMNVPLEYLLGESDDSYFYKSENPTTFHTRLEELARERKVTYAEIAHTMPFTKTYFYEWQKKKTLPSLDYLRVLAEYFRVSPDYLLGRTDYRD